MILGALIIGYGLSLLASMTETTRVEVQGTLSDRWQSSSVLRPLTVAVPECPPGLYFCRLTKFKDTGRKTEEQRYEYYHAGTDDRSLVPALTAMNVTCDRVYLKWGLAYSEPLLIAAIDPEAERPLVDLDGAITQGQYLGREDEPQTFEYMEFTAHRIPPRAGLLLGLLGGLCGVLGGGVLMWAAFGGSATGPAIGALVLPLPMAAAMLGALLPALAALRGTVAGRARWE